MARSVEMCYEHFMPAYNCPGCEQRLRWDQEKRLAAYWAELKVLPIDDPTPPQPYPTL